MRRPAVPVFGRRAGLRARGATFVEIMIAAAIMAAAFIPIAGYIRDSMRQERYEKMEAAVASFVQGKMNEFLVTRNWDAVDNASGVDKINNEGATLEVRWDVLVTPVLTGSNRFFFKHITYHTPCGGVTEANPSGVAATGNPGTTDFLQNLDRETAGGDNITYLKEIRLKVQWNWPGEPANDVRRQAAFLTRRALLR